MSHQPGRHSPPGESRGVRALTEPVPRRPHGFPTGAWPGRRDEEVLKRAAVGAPCPPPGGDSPARHMLAYPTKVKVSKAEMELLDLERHEVCPAWNDTISPRPTVLRN